MRNRRIIYGVVLILILSVFLCACGVKSDSSYYMPISENQSSTREELGFDDSMDNFIEEDMDLNQDPIEPDKIITTISITMQTKEFMDTTDKLNNLIGKYSGYIEQSNISYNNYVYNTRLKYSDYNIRIPRDNLEFFVSELKEIGNIISENKNKRDITKEYRDIESRLRVLEAKEERILALFKKAEDMEDIIALENQLSSIIYEKESFNKDIIHMDNRVNYGTVIFQLEEVAKLTSKGNVKTSFSDKIKNALNDSIYFFANTLESLLISLIYFLPYLLIILLIVFLIYRLVGRRKNRTPKNWDKKG